MRKENKVSRTARGKRDGTGPYKGSWQRKQGAKGKRQLGGKPCPKKKK